MNSASTVSLVLSLWPFLRTAAMCTLKPFRSASLPQPMLPVLPCSVIASISGQLKTPMPDRHGAKHQESLCIFGVCIYAALTARPFLQSIRASSIMHCTWVPHALQPCCDAQHEVSITLWCVHYVAMCRCQISVSSLSRLAGLMCSKSPAVLARSQIPRYGMSLYQQSATLLPVLALRGC